MTSPTSTSVIYNVLFKLFLIFTIIGIERSLVIASDVNDRSSLETALEAIEKRQRDIEMRENFGQPENIGYGFQKNLGLFEPGPAAFLSASREPDDLSPFGDLYSDKRAHSLFRERGTAIDNSDYMQALKDLWNRHQRQRSGLTDEEVDELLSGLENGDDDDDEEEEDDSKRRRDHRSYRVFDQYGPAKRSPSFGQGLYGKRSSQRVSHLSPPGDAFLYSLKWVNPAMNKEGVEALRGEEPWDDDRDADVAALLNKPRHSAYETWLREPVSSDELQYGNVQRTPSAFRHVNRLREHKRSPVKRNAAGTGSGTSTTKKTETEVKKIFGGDKKKTTVDKKKDNPKKVVRREEPQQPGEITELFRVQKKDIDWSKHFGVNKRMWADPFDTRVFNTKKNIADNLDDMDDRLGGVEESILDGAVKLTGAHGDEGLDVIRDGLVSRLETAYSLEKMRAALQQFKNALKSSKTSASTINDVEDVKVNDDGDKSKRVAVKKEGVNLAEEPRSVTPDSSECPLFEYMVNKCVQMEGVFGKYLDLLTPACTLHQICYTCGPKIGYTDQSVCDLIFLTESSHFCQDTPECMDGARQAARTLRANHDVALRSCGKNSCLADHYFNSPGVLALNQE